MDHHDLVNEIPMLEQMSNHERQKLAKKRRLQQLKKWSQREKEYISIEKQLNKRLANKLNEENNGLNLKQYSSYDSNGRTNKITLTASTTTSNQNGFNTSEDNGVILNNIKNNNNEFIENKNNPYKTNINGSNNLNITNISTTNELITNQSTSNRRVHFDVGVMLLEAAARDDFDEVKRLLMLDNRSMFYQRCIDGSEPMMKLLLEYGAKFDATDCEKYSPLHAAACTCSDSEVDEESDDEEDSNDICEDGTTPISYKESQMVNKGNTQEMKVTTRASTEMQMISELEKLVIENESKDTDKVSNNSSIANDLIQPAVFDLCDNAELFNTKLNQIKDESLGSEMEPMARSDDGLKRTQSGTNSRVHSIRRASARDKNQMSKRDVRKEAILRAEKSLPLIESTKTNSDTTNNNDNDNDNTKSQTIIIEDGKHVHVKPADKIDCNIEKEITEQTNLNLNVNQSNISKQTNESDYNSSAHSSCDSVLEKNNHTNSDKKQFIEKESLIHDSLIISTDPMATITNKSSSSSTSTKSNSIMLSAEKVDNKLTTVSLGLTTDNNSTTTAHEYKSTDKTNLKDLKDSTLFLGQTSKIVLIAPNNYTLSNLKKQRSDLRMRTSTIGGGVITSTKTEISTRPDNSDYFDEQQSTSDQLEIKLETLSDGLKFQQHKQYRSDSPSFTFRKFSGEPSETVGGKENYDHKCCTLI